MVELSEYRVVERDSITGLEASVALKVNMGYKLQGGVSVCWQGFRKYYVQALIKEMEGG